MGFQNIYLNIYFYTQIECFNKGLKFMKKKQYAEDWKLLLTSL